VKASSTIILFFLITFTALPQGNTPQLLSINTYTYTSSADSELFVREIKSYDDFGNISTDIVYVWNISKKSWMGSSKDEYSWDGKKNNNLLLKYFWDYNLGEWVNSTKREKTFDAAENITSDASYYWSSDTKAWIGTTKQEFGWNSSGKRTLLFSFYWSMTTSNWVPDLKTESTFNAHGDEVSNLTTRWTGDNYLEFYNKTENTYNASFKITRSITYNWVSLTSDWVKFYTIDYTYNTDGNLSSVVYLYSPTPESPGNGSDKFETIYDNQGNGILWNYYTWNSADSVWDNKLRNEYTFSSRGDMTSSTSMSWDTAVSDWNTQSRYDYYFDQNGKKTGSEWTTWGIAGQNTFSRGKLDYTYSDNGSLAFTSLYWSNNPTGPLTLNSRNFYSYSSAAIIFPNAEIKIFPNPFHDQLYIGVPDESQYYSLEIFDMNGKQILNTTERNADLSSLKNGIYSIRIINSDGLVIKTSKVVKQ